LHGRLLERRLDLGGELARVHDQAAARILEHVGVVGGAQQRVGRHRHDARLDRAPEEIEERGAILHHHEQPVARLQSQGQQCVAGAVHSLGELAVGDRLAVHGADRDLGRAPSATCRSMNGTATLKRSGSRTLWSGPKPMPCMFLPVLLLLS
jgi:hypothetical protein